MAKLCVTYLTFPCFDPTISDLEVQEHTKIGDYSFQEYATCNWIHHVESPIDFLTENANEGAREVFETRYNLLRKLHVQHSWLGDSAQLGNDLRELRKLYSTESIFSKIPNDGESGKLKYCLNLIGYSTHPSLVAADWASSSCYRTILSFAFLCK
jgi:hypothetical protein